MPSKPRAPSARSKKKRKPTPSLLDEVMAEPHGYRPTFLVERVLQGVKEPLRSEARGALLADVPAPVVIRVLERHGIKGLTQGGISNWRRHQPCRSEKK